MVPIFLACVLMVLLVAPALNLIGFRWPVAWLTAAILAGGIGYSAAQALGLT